MSITTHTAYRKKRKNFEVPHRSIALRLCRHSDGDFILFTVVVYFERIVMTYSIIIEAKLFYLWTTYLCSIFASLLCFHQTIPVESINSIILCTFNKV